MSKKCNEIKCAIQYTVDNKYSNIINIQNILERTCPNMILFLIQKDRQCGDALIQCVALKHLANRSGRTDPCRF